MTPFPSIGYLSVIFIHSSPAFHSQAWRCERKRALRSAAGRLLLHPYIVAHIMELNPSVSVLAAVSSITLSYGYANAPRLQSIHLQCSEDVMPQKYDGAGD